jgi:hydrogenase maturation protease
MCDDAVGIRLAGAVAERLGPRPGLDVVKECSVGGLNLIEVITGYDRVVVLDSIMTGGGVPGGWYAFDARSLRETLNLGNVHDANFATALELGRAMGTPLPADDEMHVFAVEVADATSFSETMGHAERLCPSSRRRSAPVEALLEGERRAGRLANEGAVGPATASPAPPPHLRSAAGAPASPPCRARRRRHRRLPVPAAETVQAPREAPREVAAAGAPTSAWCVAPQGRRRQPAHAAAILLTRPRDAAGCWPHRTGN